MVVERIEAIPLDKKTAMKYAEQIAQRNIGQNIDSITYLGGGSFGRAFGIDFADGKKIVIKFLRANDMMDKEIHDLKLLAENCPVKIPRVLFAQKANDEIPVDCYAMDRIEGKNVLMSFSTFFKSKRKRKKFADEVTTALHQIHCNKNDKFGDTLSPSFDNWLDCYKPFAQAVLDKAEEMYREKTMSKKVITVMRAAWAKFDIIFSEKVEEACLIHGDLNIANIMVTKDLQISGFIDPLNSTYADKEYDLFQFDNLAGKRFYLRETYTRKYGSSKYCDVKCAFYGLWNEVYCYIKTGALVNLIMNPLIKNMRKRLAEL
ncbi:MAG: aminoglycoside phosphotransferase family protein [Clostridia bacterium]|nr:aminoglycoside phosphotransferase family protein [Clostridia bacterium]MDE7328575.1 aminoglycoside phosphotransferase family protein [Clostridia bacterium]